MDDSQFADTNMLFAYSRAQAIADGVLIDISRAAKSYGFRVPVAMTAAAWFDVAYWSADDDKRQAGAGQTQAARLRDLLRLAQGAAAGMDTDVVHFTIGRVPRDGRATVAQNTQLKMAIGPGDTLDPVITIMLPSED